MPQDGDERLDYWMAQLIPDGMIQGNTIRLAPAGVLPSTQRTSTNRLRSLWEEGRAQDKDFEQLTDTYDKARESFQPTFPRLSRFQHQTVELTITGIYGFADDFGFLITSRYGPQLYRNYTVQHLQVTQARTERLQWSQWKSSGQISKQQSNSLSAIVVFADGSKV